MDDHLPGELLGARARAFERHQQSGLHLRLGAGDLGFVDGVGGGRDFVDHDAHQFGRIDRVGAGIEAEHPGIHIGRVERVDRVAQAAQLADLLEQARRHAAAEHIGEHLQAENRRIALRHAFEGERDVDLFEIALLDEGAARESRRPGRSGAGPMKPANRCAASATTSS